MPANTIKIDNNIEYTVNVPYSKIVLTKDQIKKTMGYSNEIPDVIDTAIDKCLKLIPEISEAKLTYKIFNDIIISHDSFKINTTDFNCNKNIAVYIKKSSLLLLLTATIGKKIDEHIEKYNNEKEMLLSFTLDTCGSELIENLADYFQNILSALYLNKGLKITNRYSPGYCGWDIIEQKKLFSLLSASDTGIVLTESCIMKPVKSISAVIGIGEDVKKSAYACQTCTQENCYKRKVHSE